MKSIYQVIPFVLGFGLLGCNSEQSAEPKPEAKIETVAPTEVKKPSEFVSKLPESAPTMNVAMTTGGEPFVFKTEYGVPKGIDVDIIRAIGEEQGFKVQFHIEEWKDLMPSIESGKYDIAINGINYSDERDQRYGLSNSYFYNPSSIMYIDGTHDINGIQDLTNLKVQVVEQSKQYNQLKDIVLEGNLSTAPKSFLLFQDLIQGKVDAIAMDMPVLQHSAQQFPDIKVKFVPYESESTLSANTVMVMAKENAALIKDINAGIDKIKETGEYDKIKEKWLGVEK